MSLHEAGRPSASAQGALRCDCLFDIRYSSPVCLPFMRCLRPIINIFIANASTLFVIVPVLPSLLSLQQPSLYCSISPGYHVDVVHKTCLWKMSTSFFHKISRTLWLGVGQPALWWPIVFQKPRILG